MPFLGFPLRDTRVRQLVFDGHALIEFLSEAPFGTCLAVGRGCELGSGALLRALMGRDRFGQRVLERTPRRDGLRQLGAELGFAPGEAIGRNRRLGSAVST